LGSVVQKIAVLFNKSYLSVDVDTWEPASETWMRMVPSDNDLRSLCLFKHIKHVLLINWIYWFDWNWCSALRHSKYVDYFDCVIVNYLSQHQSHHLQRNTCSTVLKHFEQSQRWNIYLFWRIRFRNTLRLLLIHSSHSSHSSHVKSRNHCF